MNSAKVSAHLSASAAILGAAILYRFPPGEVEIYPACPVFRFFHVYCPGCGATRALSALLHGHLAEALHFNAFFALFLPFLLAYFGLAYLRAIRNSHFQWPSISPAVLNSAMVLLSLFTVFRNIFQPI